MIERISVRITVLCINYSRCVERRSIFLQNFNIFSIRVIPSGKRNLRTTQCLNALALTAIAWARLGVSFSRNLFPRQATGRQRVPTMNYIPKRGKAVCFASCGFL